MSVGLAVALGAPVTVGVLPDLDVAAALVRMLATADLLSALLETPRSWPPLHPLSPEQASRVKANAA